MSNCLIAQSGGPTSVINATIAGLIKANQQNPVYEHVYGALNGIEGILMEKFVDLTNLPEEEIRILMQTPSSVLGSCRYKLQRDNLEDHKKLIKIMTDYDIETLFYIGGTDGMDTVAAMAEYAREQEITDRRFVGCPKTIDNNLVLTDHSPGYGSAAKYISAAALQSWLDLNVYTRPEVFILETMGKDSGWLAASACLSGIVDILIVPEVPFDQEAVLARVRECIKEKNKCYIVVSEGAQYADGTYLSSDKAKMAAFGYTFSGGASAMLQNLILTTNTASRVRVQDLSISQRCNILGRSLTDVTEAFRVGEIAHKYSRDKSFTGKMITLKRKDTKKYAVDYASENASEIAGQVHTIPEEWLPAGNCGITEEAKEYLRPLIEGSPERVMKDGLPAFVKPYYLR